MVLLYLLFWPIIIPFKIIIGILKVFGVIGFAKDIFDL